MKAFMQQVKWVWLVLLGLLFGVLRAQAETPVGEPVFATWISQAFGVDVSRNSAGEVSVTPLPHLAESASSWYRRNTEPGQALSSVPYTWNMQGDFLHLAFDFSEAWPEVLHAKRHVVYFMGAQHPYALVFDEIKSNENDFWTTQLELPSETVAVNWDINFADSDRQADLLAGLAGEFQAEIGLNRPVSGYAKASSGAQMLLARLLRNNNMANRYADKMSPMNIRVQGGRKWLSTEVRSMTPGIQFLIMPYTQNWDELPTTILSPNTVRLDWYRNSHQFTLFPQPDGGMNLMLKEKQDSDINTYGFGMEYVERVRPQGELVAAYDFESMTGNRVLDSVNGYTADVERGQLVEGLMGNSLYLGWPNYPDRQSVPASIRIPAAVREKIPDGHLSISFW